MIGKTWPDSVMVKRAGRRVMRVCSESRFPSGDCVISGSWNLAEKMRVWRGFVVQGCGFLIQG